MTSTPPIWLNSMPSINVGSFQRAIGFIDYVLPPNYAAGADITITLDAAITPANLIHHDPQPANCFIQVYGAQFNGGSIADATDQSQYVPGWYQVPLCVGPPPQLNPYYDAFAYYLPSTDIVLEYVTPIRQTLTFTVPGANACSDGVTGGAYGLPEKDLPPIFLPAGFDYGYLFQDPAAAFFLDWSAIVTAGIPPPAFAGFQRLKGSKVLRAGDTVTLIVVGSCEGLTAADFVQISIYGISVGVFGTLTQIPITDMYVGGDTGWPSEFINTGNPALRSLTRFVDSIFPSNTIPITDTWAFGFPHDWYLSGETVNPLSGSLIPLPDPAYVGTPPRSVLYPFFTRGRRTT